MHFRAPLLVLVGLIWTCLLYCTQTRTCLMPESMQYCMANLLATVSLTEPYRLLYILPTQSLHKR